MVAERVIIAVFAAMLLWKVSIPWYDRWKERHTTVTAPIGRRALTVWGVGGLTAQVSTAMWTTPGASVTHTILGVLCFLAFVVPYGVMTEYSLKSNGALRSVRSTVVGKAIRGFDVASRQVKDNETAVKARRRTDQLFGGKAQQAYAVAFIAAIGFGVFVGGALGATIPESIGARVPGWIDSIRDMFDPDKPDDGTTTPTTVPSSVMGNDASSTTTTVSPAKGTETTIPSRDASPQELCDGDPLAQLEAILPHQQAAAALDVVFEAGVFNTGCPPTAELVEQVGNFVWVPLRAVGWSAFVVVIAADGRASLIPDSAVAVARSTLESGEPVKMSSIYSNASVDDAEQRRAFVLVAENADRTCELLVRTEPAKAFTALPSSVSAAVVTFAAGRGYVSVQQSDTNTYNVALIDSHRKVIDRTSIVFNASDETATLDGTSRVLPEQTCDLEAFLGAYPDGEQFMSFGE